MDSPLLYSCGQPYSNTFRYSIVSPNMKCLLPLLLAVGTSLASVCEQAPAGYGPVPTPDSASAFRADPILSSIAAAGATGTVGYHPAFSGLQAAINGPNYLGVYSLRRYDSEWCANKCDITKVRGQLLFRILGSC